MAAGKGQESGGWTIGSINTPLCTGDHGPYLIHTQQTHMAVSDRSYAILPMPYTSKHPAPTHYHRAPASPWRDATAELDARLAMVLGGGMRAGTSVFRRVQGAE